MVEQNLILQFNQLPENLKQEVLDFIGYLLQKYQHLQNNHQEPEIEEKPLRQAGTMEGMIAYMADDFDAPLEDFAEYKYM